MNPKAISRLIPEEWVKGYIDPDTLYASAKDYLSFLYGEEVGLLTVVGKPHIAIYQHMPEWKRLYERAKEEISDAEDLTPEEAAVMDFHDDARVLLEQEMLVGRGLARRTKYVISFWNDDVEVYSLLGSCLRELEEYIPDNLPVEIHTPFEIMDVDRASELAQHADTRKQAGTALSPEKREELALRKKLHLLRGDEKKAALKRLGLWNPEKPEHPWQKAAPAPGQKWWAMQSEQIVKIADSLESL